MSDYNEDNTYDILGSKKESSDNIEDLNIILSALQDIGSELSFDSMGSDHEAYEKIRYECLPIMDRNISLAKEMYDRTMELLERTKMAPEQDLLARSNLEDAHGYLEQMINLRDRVNLLLAKYDLERCDAALKVPKF